MGGSYLGTAGDLPEEGLDVPVLANPVKHRRRISAALVAKTGSLLAVYRRIHAGTCSMRAVRSRLYLTEVFYAKFSPQFQGIAYPKWEPEYRSALTETDSLKLKRRFKPLKRH